LNWIGESNAAEATKTMKQMALVMTACVVLMLGCTQPGVRSPEPRTPAAEPMAWPRDWSELVGQMVTVDGWAEELKIGPYLVEDKGLDGRGIAIRMDSERWSDGYFKGSGKSKHVRVTGTVISRDDVPVYFVESGTGSALGDTSGNVIGPQGIPVYSKEELDRRKWRFLLKDVTWNVLD
jgi:hypothetical protein